MREVSLMREYLGCCCIISVVIDAARIEVKWPVWLSNLSLHLVEGEFNVPIEFYYRKVLYKNN